MAFYELHDSIQGGVLEEDSQPNKEAKYLLSESSAEAPVDGHPKSESHQSGLTVIKRDII